MLNHLRYSLIKYCLTYPREVENEIKEQKELLAADRCRDIIKLSHTTYINDPTFKRASEILARLHQLEVLLEICKSKLKDPKIAIIFAPNLTKREKLKLLKMNSKTFKEREHEIVFDVYLQMRIKGFWNKTKKAATV